MGNKNRNLKMDEESLTRQRSGKQIETFEPKFKRYISNNSCSPKSDQVNFVNQPQTHKCRQPLPQISHKQNTKPTRVHVDTDQIIQHRNSTKISKQTLNRSKLKKVLLKQRSKCHSTKRHKRKQKPPLKLSAKRLRGRSIGHQKLALPKRNQLPAGQDTPNWGMSQRSWANDRSEKQSQKPKQRNKNSNFIGRKRYSEDSSFKKKIPNHLKHRIRINMKDENTILSRPNLVGDLVDASIRTNKGLTKIDLNMKINSQFKQKIRKEMHGKSHKMQHLVADSTRLKTKSEITQKNTNSNQLQYNGIEHISNFQQNIISTKKHSIQKKNGKDSLDVNSRLKDTEPKQNQHYQSHIHQLLNTLHDKTNQRMSSNELDPLREIKRVRSQREIERGNTNIPKQTQKPAKYDNVKEQIPPAEEGQFAKVVRVRYNGNTMDLDEMPADGKIKRQLKKMGYNSFEENGKKGMRRRSSSKRDSVSSTNRSLSGIEHLFKLFILSFVLQYTGSMLSWTFDDSDLH